MHVIDRKPIDAEIIMISIIIQLIHRKHKNSTNNDTSPVFASIPIGSTVVVQ